ncbi:MAG: MBL fold metallo-hydrolase [Flavobacteriaceae bacterium]
MEKIIKRVSAVIILFFTISISAQKKEVKIISTKITNNIYMLEGQGGNIGMFIGKDGVFMIDDQFAPLTSKILSAIKKITNKPVRYLVNTHWHGDHTGGNANMQKEGAVIVSHENVRKRMSVDQIVRGRKKAASQKEALPVITFTKDMMFFLNGEDILVTHIHNAHTDGDALVYFTNSNVLHVGDAYFQKGFPYIDVDSGGSIDGYIQGIEKMIALSDDKTVIIPGHGRLSNKKELKVYLKMLKSLRTSIKLKIKEGKTLEQVKLDSDITKPFKKLSWWITEEKIKEAIYRSLK